VGTAQICRSRISLSLALETIRDDVYATR